MPLFDWYIILSLVTTRCYLTNRYLFIAERNLQILVWSFYCWQLIGLSGNPLLLKNISFNLRNLSFFIKSIGKFLHWYFPKIFCHLRKTPMTKNIPMTNDCNEPSNFNVYRHSKSMRKENYMCQKTMTI